MRFPPKINKESKCSYPIKCPMEPRNTVSWLKIAKNKTGKSTNKINITLNLAL